MLKLFSLACLAAVASAAVLPPPWANPSQNPCALEPSGGWQLLYWPEDKKCYRIFQRGYPCPETMELVPRPDRKGSAECACPPGSARSARDSRCHQLFQLSDTVCEDGQYFAPGPEREDRERWGTCEDPTPCPEQDQLFWPKDKRCYRKFTKGPCTDGQLLIASTYNDAIGECACENVPELKSYYWAPAGTCHEPYTTGPCQERGGIFLPGGQCGCDPSLPHFHNGTGKCYQLGGIGPCPAGHQFLLADGGSKAECACKEGYVKWFGDGACYRPYTRGPCAAGNMYSVNTTATGMAIGCVDVPCSAGKLYFPGGKGCHRVGTQGPCPSGQIVLFQDSVKTSIEGISYLGMCGCANSPDSSSSYYSTSYVGGEKALTCKAAPTSSARRLDNSGNSRRAEAQQDPCGHRRGTIAWSDLTCKQLYMQGPCEPGEWVVPDRGKGTRKGRGWKMGKCECRPGYTAAATAEGRTVCQAPTVSLARFLNTNVTPTAEGQRDPPLVDDTQERETTGVQ
ncbi:uncharacterized protein LOC126906845 [Daktulosphaira vitifoliae]|uniref:uncharacterized protein LOC126906845 n=1 Tax=Daktulosphaira vitifoliae TaxID=58002 RepID=UPI0021AA00FE|nr:uncharacterized protein LOC126906845 [Daktulosphaira vitifoliae]XP_050543702.1 uncharacterized protein LOC126906845 [Daktulosphaira vitifoliae]XP_050543703.1 uncharacterized protein LOC126906845 [Daktulosphaira vitifoliae]XP_050543704.1 uncharacterized protein LOC126906845 [Daktulosphaira vitifoliae]XP_050543705.1 uncharacterized protein LOC126906845 [Daktulosphaira vitifoliae]